MSSIKINQSCSNLQMFQNSFRKKRNRYGIKVEAKSSEIQDRRDFELLERGAISIKVRFLSFESKLCGIDLRSKMRIAIGSCVTVLSSLHFAVIFRTDQPHSECQCRDSWSVSPNQLYFSYDIVAFDTI